MGSISVSSCICCMCVSCVHPVVVFNAAFCWTCRLLILVEDTRGNHMEEAYSRLQMTQHTSGGDVTAITNCCANCVETSRAHFWGSDFPFLLHFISKIQIISPHVCSYYLLLTLRSPGHASFPMSV